MKAAASHGAILMSLILVGFASFAVGTCEVRDEPIVISSDYEFTRENGVVAGGGTSDDPYIIDGWSIDAVFHNYGIRIEHTSRYFVIRNVRIMGAAKAGIFLSYVRNGRIEQSSLDSCWIGIVLSFCTLNRISSCSAVDCSDGIHLYFSKANQIFDNQLNGNDTAVWLDGSNENEILRNVITDNAMGAYLELGSEGNLLYDNVFVDNVHAAHSDALNHWDCKERGNYWSGYRGLDADEDGIGDAPYVIRSDGDQDSFPLLTLP
jgi:parallel beta-helix repeat protein